MTTQQNSTGNQGIASPGATGLIQAFSEMSSCACAILDPVKHRPVFATGWNPEWEEFASVLPPQPDRFFTALSKLNWSELAKKPTFKFESAGHIVHALAPVVLDGNLQCFVYAGYLLSTKSNDGDYLSLARERKFDSDRFLQTIQALPVLPESALTAALTKLVAQMKRVLEKAPPTVEQQTTPTVEQPTNSKPPSEAAPLPWEADNTASTDDAVTSIPVKASAPSPGTPSLAPKRPAEDESAIHLQIIRSLTRDIRTALNGTIGVTGLLMRRKDPEVTELLDTVHRGNDTLLTMLDNLHDYYDVISGQLPVSLAPFDVRIATERAVESVRKKIEETGVKLNVRFAEDIPEVVLGDAIRFQQVLRNSLTTVARYSVGGRLILAARNAGIKESGTELQFLIQNVVDSGEDSTASIDDDSAIVVYDSSDIGMIVSREVVRLLGGKMVVRTSEPPSAIFSIKAREIDLSTFAFDTHGIPAMRSLDVAIIHPDPIELSALSLQCGYWGPGVYAFEGAEQAFESLSSSEPVDAIVISHNTPLISQFVDKVRSSRLHSQLPIIVYAGDVPVEQAKNNIGSTTQLAVWDTLRDIMLDSLVAGRESSPQPDMVNTLADLYPSRILVVEDDAMNRQLIDRILKKLGYKPSIAANGIEAVKITGEKPFDLIFMDLQMPGMDGITATKTILSDTAHTVKPKIIALSANASAIDREGAFKAGMVDFLAKPIILDKLQEAIEKWSEKSQPETSASSNKAQSSSDLVDANVINQTRELDQFSEESVLDRLIQGFIKEVPPIISEIENGFTSNNTYTVTKATGTLVGMCRNLGVKEFARIAKDIETSAATSDLPTMSKKFSALKKSYQNTCNELKLYMTSSL